VPKPITKPELACGHSRFQRNQRAKRGESAWAGGVTGKKCNSYEACVTSFGYWPAGFRLLLFKVGGLQQLQAFGPGCAPSSQSAVPFQLLWARWLQSPDWAGIELGDIASVSARRLKRAALQHRPVAAFLLQGGAQPRNRFAF